MERVKMAAEKLAEAVDEMNEAEQRFMCQYDTMMQMFFDKEKLLVEQMEKMRNHYFKIIVALTLSLLLLIGGLVGGMIYIFANYDFGVVAYQDISVGNDGSPTIEDGIQVEHTPSTVK